MLTRGCKGLREEAQARLAALEDPRDLAFRKPFYEAAIITCDALSLLARRYSELASQMAAQTKDAQRKKELEEIAAICAWVPENPARTFREAIQAQWFTQLFSRLEEMVGGQVNQGRMDQYLYPIYKKDIEEGRITPEAAQELFQCLWLHIMQSIESQMSPSAAKGREGLELIPTYEPELILMDMHMPVMNGWQFAEAFHAQYESKIPLVVFTAFDDAERIAESVGAQAYVSKPFGVKDLLSTVRQFM
jgi:CheY-like chemotaxis protein